MLLVILAAVQGTLARLSGSGFGQKWGASWLPEALFAMVFGGANALVVDLYFGGWWAVLSFVLSSLISYAGMQSATGPILPWDVEGLRNPNKKYKLRPVADWIAARFKVQFDSEAYAWIWAAIKGFIIGLPVGGVLLAVLWPLGYEIGSHTRGRVEKWGLDAHALAEVFTGIGAGVSIYFFLTLFG